MSFRGKLALASVIAAAALGCRHTPEWDRQQGRPVPPPEASEQPRTTLPKTPEAPLPGTEGTEVGRGGAGAYKGGMPESTPSTTTPRSSSGPMTVDEQEPGQPPSERKGERVRDEERGTGGAGPSERQKQMREDCIRNQIGSPASSDLICPEDETAPMGGTGAAGTEGENPIDRGDQ